MFIISWNLIVYLKDLHFMILVANHVFCTNNDFRFSLFANLFYDWSMLFKQISAYPRQLESLVRLAECHARMRLSNEVTVNDCREARRLQREALKQAAIDPVTGVIDINILTTGLFNI